MATRELGGEGPFPPSLLYAAAKLYYLEDATQAQIAARLGLSRATVSRVLSAARGRGIVRIEVVPPTVADHADLAERTANTLGLQRVFLSGPLGGGQRREHMGDVLAPAVDEALAAAGLHAGDILLVSSGRTIYEVASAGLSPLPGVVVVPTVGGSDQPEGWYQTNEITRLLAGHLEGRATYLFAPAMPGSELYASLRDDPTIQRVLGLWAHAKAVLMGVGAPPLLRRESPAFVPPRITDLREAVGDVCSRFYDRSGVPIDFPGSDQMIAVSLNILREIPVGIAVAVGAEKVDPVLVGARAGYFNQLVTDPKTAELLLART